ncbi:hypothetical protein MBANPS3_005714 [Mucor bainieri]
MPTKFTIFIPSTIQPSIDSDQLSSEIKSRLTDRLSNFKYKANFPIHVSVLEQDEVDGHKEANIGHYFIYIDRADKIDLEIGSERSSFLKINDLTSRHTSDNPFLDSIAETLATVIPPVYLSEYQNLGDMACHIESKDKNDVSSMRAFKYSSQYETTFSLMNNNPENMKMDWEIRDAVNAYLSPFLKEVSVLSNFTIDSQIQNYAPLSLKPHYKERVGKPSYYYFEPQHLPHFVNSAEWNLASTITSYPSINFVLYVPSAEEAPLRIHNSKGSPTSQFSHLTCTDIQNTGQPLLTSAFLIPRWGGIVIKNPPKAATEEYTFTKKDLQPIMKIFISQLRSLIGVHDLQNSISNKFPANYHVVVEPATKYGITTLEKDNLIRSRTLENVVNTISTLKSLAQLVDEIPNMVVEDHISIKVRQSLDALDAVSKALSAEDYIMALQSSIETVELAEKAFFDPTMVSMLYFPDEHKYAIYMPLFVPISVPLVMALLKEIKKLKQAKKIKKKED